MAIERTTATEPSYIHPELRTVARFLPKTYALHRGLGLPRKLMDLAAALGRLREVTDLAVDDEVGLRVYRPASHHAPGPALLWIHGGGKVMGRASQDDRFCRKLANSTDIAVAAVDYRLAPEHPYPTPVRDCYAALQTLAAQPWVDPQRIAIAGASGGGGIAAVLARWARDRGEIRPAVQMLVYPMLDDRTGARRDGVERVLWTGGDNQLAWQWYLGDADPESAVPARLGDLAGLAPAWIGVGTADLFHDESVAYAERLAQAGVPVQLEIAEGGFHAFDLIAANASISQRFFARQCRALRAALIDSHNSDGSVA